MHWGSGWGMGGFGWIAMAAFWALVIVVVIFLIRSFAGSTKSQGKAGTALDILKERYAKGEINREEFEEKKKGLL
ncbi:MAG TPA: SHOCT domain-containing protein [Nitrospirae bacterium]|nr:hypothetical protein BMS3Abin10_00027 [bacterium BMS3Abin10]GBE37897.1 hypothetical protein BMS3Bbin08_00495 [bacterium BMS3Bbin08]HDH50241.1 SHOCT domain-containing protein [Nitrospirota bacterium]HDK17636.1 SHOCT domain-containing protein [Nitrospirota bacterium]HDK81119.1 SHOCT domain-containing protein [Nitrospirota bacterium]